jgi:hypothetical protein
LVSIDESDPTKKIISTSRISRLVNLFSESKDNINFLLANSDEKMKISPKTWKPLKSHELPTILASSARRFFVLFQRAIRQTFRDASTNIGRLAISSVLSFIVGSIYSPKETNKNSVNIADTVNIIAQVSYIPVCLSVQNGYIFWFRELSMYRCCL